jgi:C-terminal processing protease CtpA/Prc
MAADDDHGKEREDDLRGRDQEEEERSGDSVQQEEQQERRRSGYGHQYSTFSEKESLEFEILATKTNGKLRLDICEDVADDERRGLFVQNFLRPCVVEEEGLVFIGDELISINKHNVDGFTIDELVEVLQVADHPQNPTVLLGIRRRRNQRTYQSLSYENNETVVDTNHRHDQETNSGNGSADDGIDFDDPQVIIYLPLPSLILFSF